jgi:hypothetical protein
LTELIEESCSFQKIYGLGKVKPQIKYIDKFAKTQVENVKEIN